MPAGIPAATPAPGPARRQVALTLVTGASPASREAAIAALLATGAAAPPAPAVPLSVPSLPEPPSDPGLCVVLLEGLASGQHVLVPTKQLHVHRIAPGCLCCTGNLVLRVTLNRILRLKPERLYIGLASVDHLDQLRSWLQQPPYDQLLVLTADLHT